MVRERVIPRLAVTLPLSLLLHGGLVLLFAARGQAEQSARVSPEASLEAPERSPEPQLGLDKELPASVDWVGYDEYRKHLARLAETEQAAMTDKPPPGGPEESPDSTAQDVTEAAAPSPPDVTAPDVAGSPASEDEAVDHDVQEPAADPRETVTAAPEAVPIMAPKSATADVPESMPIEPARLNPLLGPVVERIEEMIRASVVARAEASLQESPATQSRPTQSPSETPPPVPAAPSAPSVPPGQPVEHHDETGDVTDRQSDATSRLDVTRDQWQMGKPLAGKGVEIKPRRAEVPLFTRFTAAIRANPICRMEFDRGGRVVRAMILAPSGDPRVDENILNSLYSWRASGASIEALGDNDVFVVELRYVLMSGR